MSISTVELAACQVFAQLSDYASEESFHRMLGRVGRRLDDQRARTDDGRFAHECLAVFPEMIGTFLPIAGRAFWIRGARTTNAALTRIALRSLPSVIGSMIQGGTTSTNVGFLLAVSPDVRRIYRDAFRWFARQHECWVVAGSALLPRNVHGDLADRFEPDGGRVFNTSYAFDPEGRHIGCVRKVNLVPTLEDTLGLSPGSADELTPIETSFGRVGTLICYDGFHVPHTRGEPKFQRLVARYDALGCSILAQPSANPWPWEGPWIFAERGETQLRREQWESEGLLGQLRGGRFENIRFAIVPQLLGQLLDTCFDGRSQIFERRPSGVSLLGESPRADATSVAEDIVLRVVLLDRRRS